MSGDALAILKNSSQVPLLHMETLRRATLYARKDPAAAKQLFVATRRPPPKAPKPHPVPTHLPLFDAGLSPRRLQPMAGGKERASRRTASTVCVDQTRLRLHPNDPQMRSPPRLITLRGPEADHREYAQLATAGAKNDELLNAICESFLGEQSQTMSEMILKNNATKAARQ